MSLATSPTTHAAPAAPHEAQREEREPQKATTARPPAGEPDRPELADGEFHLLDLVGLEARLAGSDEPIGTVSNLISGGNDLLEIKLHSGKTVLVPFVEAIVPEVQLEEGWLLLTPPPGLLEL